MPHAGKPRWSAPVDADTHPTLPRYRIVPTPNWSIKGECRLEVRRFLPILWFWKIDYWDGLAISADIPILRKIAADHSHPKTFPPAPEVEYIA